MSSQTLLISITKLSNLLLRGNVCLHCYLSQINDDDIGVSHASNQLCYCLRSKATNSLEHKQKEKHYCNDMIERKKEKPKLSGLFW